MSSHCGPPPDWTNAFEEPFRDAFFETVRALQLDRLGVYPPPKRGGLFVGHELRILRRFLARQSSSLDPSGLSRVYRALATSSQRLLYRAFVTGDPLTAPQWSELIGSETRQSWAERDLFAEHVGARLSLRLRIVAVNGLVLVVDPPARSIHLRVHIGQDSLNMLEFVRRRWRRSGRRLLDVGTGSGLLLAALGDNFDDALGVDVNQRAVRLARLNIELNERSKCRVADADVFVPEAIAGPFDLVTWNTPFMFFPDNEAAANVDGAGGHLGIATTLRFVDRLPNLLDDRGEAYLLSAAPIMDDGHDGLQSELVARSERWQMDITMHVLQAFWVPSLAEFHRGFGIRRFESVMLRIARGRGSMRRIAPAVPRRMVDFARGVLYDLRWGNSVRPKQRGAGVEPSEAPASYTP